MNEDRKQVLIRTIIQNGASHQMMIAMEECGELVQAISKLQRNRDDDSVVHLAEEIADVTIVLEELKLMFEGLEEKVAEFETDKIARLESNLEKDLVFPTVSNGGDSYDSKEELAKYIGRKIKNKRIAKKMNQEDIKIAERRTISNWETGRTLPSIVNLFELCEVFGCKMSYFLGEE